MPPSTAAIAATITDRSNWMPPSNTAMRTTPPPATTILPTKMNLRELSILTANSSICSSSHTISSRWSLPSMAEYRANDEQLALTVSLRHVRYAPKADIRIVQLTSAKCQKRTHALQQNY